MRDPDYWCRVCLEHHVVTQIARIHEANQQLQQEDEK